MNRIPIAFASPNIEQTRNGDGSFIWASREPLASYPDDLSHWLHHWAEQTPEVTFLAQRDAQGQWRHLSYRQALSDVRAVAAALLSQGRKPGAVMLLSENSIENATLLFACMYVGIPAVPVSPAYSLMSSDLAKVRYIANLIQPTIVFASDGNAYSSSLNLDEFSQAEKIVVEGLPDGMPATLFSSLKDSAEHAAVEDARATIGPETVAKVLFTSGSTGMPKGVINTQRMLCSNQQAMSQVWPFQAQRKPVIIDWLPWNHTFGGNHNLNMILWHGGTMYIDAGKPAPGLIDATIQNMREVPSTIHFNVPRGFEMIASYLEKDDDLRDTFFSELDLIFYAAAALPQNVWARFEKLSMAARGGIVPMTSSWGATETAPAVTAAHFSLESAGIIGVPVPGTELKFLPNAGKYELRVRGPQITPGYYRQPELSAEAFDDDGFYKIGDAGKPADASDPNKGVIFDGRVAEDFKLLSGTWVSAGNLRIAVVEVGAPLIQDVVITGHDRDDVGLLIFANMPACVAVAGMSADADPDEVLASDAVQGRLKAAVASYNERNKAASVRVARALLMHKPASIDANEITDKGYVNQRAVLEARADLVERLYAGNDSKVMLW